MDNSLDLKYQEQINKHLGYINQVRMAFEKQCEKLRNETEIAISQINQAVADKHDQEIKIKIELKKKLNTTLEEFEDALKKSFGNNLVMLEEIYRQKENMRLKEFDFLFTQNV